MINMNCKKCGNTLYEKDTFCFNCGAPVERYETPVTPVQPAMPEVAPVQPAMPQQPEVNMQVPNQEPTMSTPVTPISPVQPTTTYQEPNKKKSPIVKIILGVVLLVVVVLAILLVKIFVFSKELSCTSDDGTIVLKYDDEELLGYAAEGFTFDLDKANESVEVYGIDQFLEMFRP